MGQKETSLQDLEAMTNGEDKKEELQLNYQECLLRLQVLHMIILDN